MALTLESTDNSQMTILSIARRTSKPGWFALGCQSRPFLSINAQCPEVGVNSTLIFD